MADAGVEYIIGVLFATVATFVVYMGYKIIVPVYVLVAQPIATLYPSLVNNNPTYVNGFQSLVVNLDLGLQSGLFIMALGISFAFIIMFGYRRQGTSSSVAEGEY